MTAAPEVSIIVPTYNRPALLRRSVASALAQTGAHVEVVVVDDGSEPPADVDEDAALGLVRTANAGASAARNAGLARARGTYVMFLDSDDWLEPDAVATLLETVRTQASAVAFGRWRNVHEGSGATSVAAPATPYADSLANAVCGGWVGGSFLVSRETAARFDVSLTIWEVVVFMCESLAHGGAAASCDAVLVNVFQHDDPGRISVSHDHFEPLATARIFAALKTRLADQDLLNGERIAALDGRLLPCLASLLRAGRPEAREVYAAIDWTRIARQSHYRPGSFAWCARLGGLAGARWFTAVNRAIGR